MPFLTGATVSALQSFGMKLPLKLVENLRSLLLHIVQCPSPNDIEMLYPVIGQYFGEQLSDLDYPFSSLNNVGVPVQNPLFATTPPILKRRRHSKTGEDVWEKILTETVIDLIDTSNGTSYTFINDPNRLQTLTTLWNDHISQFAAYSDPLTPFSADPGINVLNSTNQTRYWVYPSTVSIERVKDTQDERVTSRRNLSSSVYATKQAIALSFREMPFQATHSITSQWILPVCRVQVGSASPNSSTFVKIACMNEETLSTTLSSTGDVGLTFAALHDAFASSMVHAKGTESELTVEMQNLAKEGHAGILSSLVAGFLGNTFGTTVGTLASTVASVLPI